MLGFVVIALIWAALAVMFVRLFNCTRPSGELSPKMKLHSLDVARRIRATIHTRARQEREWYHVE